MAKQTDPTEPSVPKRQARKLSPARADLLKGDATQRVVGVLKDGSSIVATLSALYVLTDEAVHYRVPWHLVEYAGYDGDTNILTVRTVESPSNPQEFALDGNVLDVATVVKERVDASVIHHEQTLLDDGTLVRAALRRDETGELLVQTTAVASGGFVPADHPRVQDLVRRVRQTVGLV